MRHVEYDDDGKTITRSVMTTKSDAMRGAFSITDPQAGRRGLWLLPRLAWQNLGRQPTRTCLLVLAVALGSGAVFTTLTVARGIQASMDAGFARMGADLIIVPKDTLVNITSALLTVEPTDHTLDAKLADEVSRLPGVSRVAPQRLYRVGGSGGGHDHETALVGFDAARDFSVQPWLSEKLDRPPKLGDVLVGGRREEKVGETAVLGGRPLTVYGRLHRTGVGPFDGSCFVTFATVDWLAQSGARLPGYDPAKVSALLVELQVGATPEQVRFAIARIPGVKVAAGGSVLTSTRQGLTALFGGAAVVTALLLLGCVVMVSVLYSAIIAERRREVGMLRAVGARCRQVVQLFVVEAAFTTGLGGFCGTLLGVSLLLLVRRSLGYYFQTINVPFLWPAPGAIAGFGAGCVLLAAAVGVLGAFLPALRTGRQEPYQLIQSAGK
jgi:putative ABC transport system permease protein